jgi:hypothetical protein
LFVFDFDALVSSLIAGCIRHAASVRAQRPRNHPQFAA